MTSRTAAAAAVLAAGLLLPRSAAALKITTMPVSPVAVGQTQTFAIASAVEATGAVTVHWDFGDGAMADSAQGAPATHAYAAPGHYSLIVKASDDASNAYASFVQTVHYPLPPVPPRNASSIILDAANHQVWNVNPDTDSISVIDANTGARQREIAVGKEPHSLAQAPDGTIWVANQMSDELVLLDRSTGAITDRVALPYASQPRSIVFSANGASAYVSLFATGKLVEINALSHKVSRSVALGPTPFGVSVGADGKIYVTRFISPLDHGEVWVVAPDTLGLTNTIVLAFDQTKDSAVNGRGVPNFVASFAISPDGTQAWVTAEKPNMARGPMRDGLSMNSDSFVRSILCVVDLSSGMELLDKRLDLDNRNMPVAVAFSPIGDYGYVALETDNEIFFQDAYTLTNLGAIKNVGNAPDGLVLGPDAKLWVNSYLSRQVIAYDMTSSIASIDQTAPNPLFSTRTIDHETLSNSVLLGKQIFFNAADPRMDRVGYMSCASCHFNGFTDGRTWDFTDRGEGLRNTKSLLGVRGALGEGRIHWSANMDEIQDFERDIRDSLEGFGFMPQAAYDTRKGPSGTYDTLGTPAAGTSPELDALAAYVNSLDKVPRSPFRNPDGSFTTAALAGQKVFARSGCPQCHSGPDFTDSPSGMLHDVGTILPTSGKRLFGALTGIDTPTLKGVWATAPYYHDGRAATLMEIFTKYNAGDRMGMTSNLSATELGQLVEYLQELDDVPAPPVKPTADPPTHAKCSVSSVGAGGPNKCGWLAAISCALAVARARERRRRMTRKGTNTGNTGEAALNLPTSCGVTRRKD